MRTARIAPALGILMIPALALAMSVSVEFDGKAAFPGYRTYSWGDSSVEGNPLVQERILAALRKQLSSRGMRWVQEGAEVLVVYHGSTRKDFRGDLWGYAPGPGWKAPGGTGADGSTKQLVWRGVARDTLSDNPLKHEKKINKAVAKMFSSYPPRPKK